jgi:hypothetical protein
VLLVRCRQGFSIGFESRFCVGYWRVSHIVRVIYRIYEVRLEVEITRFGKT